MVMAAEFKSLPSVTVLHDTEEGWQHRGIFHEAKKVHSNYAS